MAGLTSDLIPKHLPSVPNQFFAVSSFSSIVLVSDLALRRNTFLWRCRATACSGYCYPQLEPRWIFAL
jgi:hypothetical protein